MKNINILNVSIILSSCLVFWAIYTFIVSPMGDPKVHDLKIIKSYEEACVYQDKFKKFEHSMNTCKASKEEEIALCKEKAFMISGINHYSDFSDMAPGVLDSYTDALVEARLPLSDGSLYKGSCVLTGYSNIYNFMSEKESNTKIVAGSSTEQSEASASTTN